MFGDYGIYCDGKVFGLICDDKFFLKPTETIRPLLRKAELRPPYEPKSKVICTQNHKNA